MTHEEEMDGPEQDDPQDDEELDFGSIHEIISIYEAHLKREPGRKIRRTKERHAGLDQTIK